MTREEAMDAIERIYGGSAIDSDPEWAEQMARDMAEDPEYAESIVGRDEPDCGSPE